MMDLFLLHIQKLQKLQSGLKKLAVPESNVTSANIKRRRENDFCCSLDDKSKDLSSYVRTCAKPSDLCTNIEMLTLYNAILCIHALHSINFVILYVF